MVFNFLFPKVCENKNESVDFAQTQDDRSGESGESHLAPCT